MKRFILLLSIFLTGLVHEAQARGSFGVVGGVRFSSAKLYDGENPAPGHFTGGIAFNVDLPAGFTIQPAVNFVKKEAYFGETVDYIRNNIEVPVSFQWGPDLMIFRPFLDVTPYVDFMVSNDKGYYVRNGQEMGSFTNVDSRKSIGYGLGVGGGIDVWRLRFIARYNWNFGAMFNEENISDLGVHEFGEDNFKGLTLTMAFFMF